ncbi:MAG TPA: dTDP-4-dehydrorhamnose 3,5-epimerase [Methylophilaceae bacterium]|jgi:dTDP-4-dehydrorhamnose 3,5-epimerase
MRFVPTPIVGAYVVEPELIEDERGFFARTYCRDEFLANGLNPDLLQCSISFNKRRGTLRGMHYQKAPYAETKLVRCTQGAIFDVIIDLNRESASYLQWFGIELTAEKRNALYIPPGLLHGFQTLSDDAEILYQISEVYRPEYSAGFRWNDASFGIDWPEPVTVMSQRDKSYPDFID